MSSMQSVARSIAARDWSKAEKKLRLLRRRHPDRPDVPYNLALVIRECGRFDEAVEILSRTAARFPGYAFASFELANTLLAMGRETDARDQLEHHLARWEDDEDAHLLAARIWLRQGNTDKATEHLAEIERQIADDNHDAKFLEAQISLRTGDFERTRALFRQLSRAAPYMRPNLLKELTQSPRGRIPLDSRRLGWG